MKKLSLLAAALVVAAAPMIASAESTFSSGATTPLTATARLDFKVTIPRILFLQVGTGTNMATNGTINLIDFTVPAANVGDSSVIAASAGAGDLGNGVVTAKLIGNAGTISLSSATLGTLNNGAAGDTISYGQINTAATTLASATPLPAPALADGATTTVSVAPASGKVVNQDAKWTYTYKNQNVVAPGTYGGVNVQNGRVTYTASMP